jgi:hypothetical protein
MPGLPAAYHLMSIHPAGFVSPLAGIGGGVASPAASPHFAGEARRR